MATGSTAPLASRVERPASGRKAMLLLVLTAAVLGSALASLFLGARTVAPGAVFDALFATDPLNPEHVVVLSRLPRTLGGLLVGAALGLAGGAMQGLTRNPLADPGILGINAGAALGVVGGIALFGINQISSFMPFAFGGAALAIVFVYLIASVGREGATPIKLALAGAALSAGLASVTSAILMVSQAALDDYRFWQVGTLAARGADHYLATVPFIAVGALLVLRSARTANAVAMGDDTATALGFRLGRERILGALGIVLLAGVATAAVGPIGFVGLMVPHAMRMVVGHDYRWLLPASALGGPILVLLADVAGRIIAPPSEVQVGVMCAILGAPLFILLMRRGLKGGAL